MKVRSLSSVSGRRTLRLIIFCLCSLPASKILTSWRPLKSPILVARPLIFLLMSDNSSPQWCEGRTTARARMLHKMRSAKCPTTETSPENSGDCAELTVGDAGASEQTVTPQLTHSILLWSTNDAAFLPQVLIRGIHNCVYEFTNMKPNL